MQPCPTCSNLRGLPPALVPQDDEPAILRAAQAGQGTLLKGLLSAEEAPAVALDCSRVVCELIMASCGQESADSPGPLPQETALQMLQVAARTVPARFQMHGWNALVAAREMLPLISLKGHGCQLMFEAMLSSLTSAAWQTADALERCGAALTCSKFLTKIRDVLAPQTRCSLL
jgi:hypothetical protein